MRNLFLLILVCIMCNVDAQVLNDSILNHNSDIVYIQVTVMSKMNGNRAKVRLHTDKLTEVLVDQNGKEVQFNSLANVLNYFDSRGFTPINFNHAKLNGAEDYHIIILKRKESVKNNLDKEF